MDYILADNLSYTNIYPQNKLSRPHVETNYNDDALRGTSSNSDKPIALLGSATNGEPGVVYKLDDVISAKRIFGSGDIVDAAQLIWNYNGKGSGSGGSIYAMRIEDATPSVLNASGLQFKSRMWGENANNIALALEVNPLDDTYRMTVDYAADNYHQVYDNLGKLFRLQYKGNSPAAKATYTVKKDSKTGLASHFIVDIYDADSSETTTTLSPTTTSSTMFLNSTTTSTTDKDSGTTTSTSTTTTTTEDPSHTTSTSTTTTTKADGSQTTTTTTTAKDQGAGTAQTTTTTANSPALHHIQQDYDLSLSQHSMLYELMDKLSMIPNMYVYMTANSDNTTIPSTALDEAHDVNIAWYSGSLQPVQPTTTPTTTYLDGAEIVAGQQQANAIPVRDVMLKAYDDQTTTTTTTNSDNSTLSTTAENEDDADSVGWVWGIQGDIIDKMQYDDYVTVSAVYTEPLTQPFGLTHMINGSTGKVPYSWANKLKVFAKVPAYYIVPLTSFAAVHQEVKSFVNDQFNGGRNMRAFVGAGTNEQVGRLIARQIELKSARVSLIGTSGYFTMPDQSTIPIPAYMVAALAAGVASSLPIGGAITNKYINMISVDQDFSSSELDQLNANGVISVEPIINRGVSSGFRFVQDVTTYNAPKEKVKSRISLGEITDFVFDDLRQYLEKNWIGINVKKASADLLKEAVNSFLYKRTLDPNSYIVDYDSNDIQVLIDGDQAWIYFTVRPSQTLDSIYVYGAYENFRASSTNSSSSGTAKTSSSYNVLYSGDQSDIFGTDSTKGQ